MIRRHLRALLRLDRYEWVGIACGVIVLTALTGVLGPTLDAQSTLTAQDSGRKIAVVMKD